MTLSITALALAGCANSDPAADDRGAEAGREPTAVPQPRLVVSSEGGAEVLDGMDLTSLGSFELASQPYLSKAGDDRHVFVLQSEVGQVGVVDAGTWTDAHGDHGHSYVTEPSLLESTFDHGTSYHAVSDDERSVLWFDDDGSFRSFDWAGLEDDAVQVQTVETGTGHHGVAVPTADGGFLASYSEGDGAAGLLVLGPDGAETARIDGCDGLHGEAHAGEGTYVFGCADGVLVVEDGAGARIDAPVDGGGTGSLVGEHDSSVLVGNLYAEDAPELARQLAFYDVEQGNATALDLGVEFGAIARADGEAAVLGTDGSVRLIDPETGEVTETFEVMESWVKPEGHGSAMPQVSLGGGFAWVMDPRDRSVALFELGSGEERARTTLDAEPASLVVVNAP